MLNYSTTTEYEPGDVVRIRTKRYKCRGLPNGLWCKNPAYAPSLKPGLFWEQAWSLDGICLQPAPSQSPSTSPTKAPVVSPTQNVSILLVVQST